jgi:hypothetical protein
MCGEPIGDITSALAQPNDGEPVHFDCTLRSAVEELQPSTDEKVIYLGNGDFAVVSNEAYQKRQLKIVRRTVWEKQEEKSEWRIKLRAELR